MVGSPTLLVAFTRIFLILVVVVSGFLAYRINTSAVQLDHVNHQLSMLLRGERVDVDDLLLNTDTLVGLSVLDGDYQDIYANVLALVRDHEGKPSRISKEQVAEAYRVATGYMPYDARLWSRYAVQRASLSGIDNETLAAIDNALRYGRNNYNTLKNLVLLAIRYWPFYDCTYKRFSSFLSITFFT